MSKITAVFHTSSNYEYYFKINELAEQFGCRFEYLGENAEKYVTFSVPIKKETESCETIASKINSVI